MNAEEVREVQSNLPSHLKEKSSSSPRKNKKQQILVNQQFLVQECIYKGSFYNTYKGYDKVSKKNVVIKMCNQYHEHISDELKIMKNLQNATCFASPIWSGEEKISGVNYQVKVLNQMGPSLKIVFGLQGSQFQIGTIFLIALNLINSIENLHKHDIVHRNLRPRKIITDFNLKSLSLYFVDFKNARKFKHRNGQIVRYTETNRLQNRLFSSKFSSLGVHMGISPCMKDDLESLGYILIYFLNKGKLFQKKKTYINRDEKISHYEEQKLNFVVENYKDIIPPEIMNFLTYLKMLNQNDKVDYDFIKKQFKLGYNRVTENQQMSRYEWASKIEEDLKNYSNQLKIQKEQSASTNKQKSDAQNIIIREDVNPLYEILTPYQDDTKNIQDAPPNANNSQNLDITQGQDQIQSYNTNGIHSPYQDSHHGSNSPKYSAAIINENNSQIAPLAPIKNKSALSQLNNSINSPGSIQNKRTVSGTMSQANVEQYGPIEIGEKYDYQAFLRMNSTDEPRLTSGNQGSEYLLKDPYQKQLSNMSKKSDVSLFSRFNSKSFDEGISDEITTQYPSLEKQINQLGNGINTFSIFSLANRGKYFKSQSDELHNNNHQFFQQNAYKINEIDNDDQFDDEIEQNEDDNGADETEVIISNRGD